MRHDATSRPPRRPTPGTAPGVGLVRAVRAARPFVIVAARGALVGRNRSRSDPTAGRFTPAQVHGLVGGAFARFKRRVPELPREPTRGSRQNVTLAALTLSLLESLEEAGIERDYAIELTGDTCWRFYRYWGQVTRGATRLASRDPVRRLRLSVNAFLTFPFGRPGYGFDDVAQQDGRSLDMRRCPVSDYLGAHSAADLCGGSWCNLDYALAEMWGAKLYRSGTLVSGAQCCDFRFRVTSSDDSGSTAGVRRWLPIVPGAPHSA